MVTVRFVGKEKAPNTTYFHQNLHDNGKCKNWDAFLMVIHTLLLRMGIAHPGSFHAQCHTEH